MLRLVRISVIIPVYNVEDYLTDSLDSILNQTFEDLEILCIDDGSTDSSPDILEEYSIKDKRIRIFTQKNQGPAKARNLGLDNATGDFIYFMDSDDILKESALERLYNLAHEKELDLVVFKMINFNDETGERFTTKYYEMKFLKKAVGDNVFSHRDLKSEEIFRVTVSPPSKLFKKSLIEDIRFPCGLYFEDNPFFVEAFLRAERVCFCDEYLYERRIRKGSITSTTSNRDFMDYLEISQMLIDITKRYGLYEQYRKGLYLKTIDNIYLWYTRTDEQYRQEFFERIKEYFSSKRDEYDNDVEFTQGPEKLKRIFYNALECNTYKEYESSIEQFKSQDRQKNKSKTSSKENENSTNFKSRNPLKRIRKLF